MSTAAIVAGTAGSSLAGSAIASSGASHAADTQAQASAQAAAIQAQSAREALDFQKQQYADTQRILAPLLSVGRGGLVNLAYLMGIGGPQSNFVRLPNGGVGVKTPAAGSGAVPGAPTAPAGASAQPSDPFASYRGRNFNDLIHSGDPLVSPDQQTTDAWTRAGVPFQNIISSDGRSVAVRTDMGAPNVSGASAPAGVPGPGEQPWAQVAATGQSFPASTAPQLSAGAGSGAVPRGPGDAPTNPGDTVAQNFGMPKLGPGAGSGNVPTGTGGQAAADLPMTPGAGSFPIIKRMAAMGGDGGGDFGGRRITELADVGAGGEDAGTANIATGPDMNPGPTTGPDMNPGPGGAPGAPANPADPNAGGDQVTQLPDVNPALGDYGSLLAPWTENFKAPDALSEQNDPGYQARLQLSTDAMERSAAARGGILTGGTAADLGRYAQDYASNEYGNVYNRAFNDFTTRYNIDQQNKANLFNRLSAIAGTEQTTAGQLSAAGANFGNNAGSIAIGSGNSQASGINNAAAARASAYQNSGNIYGNAISGLPGGILSTLQAIRDLQG